MDEIFSIDSSNIVQKTMASSGKYSNYERFAWLVRYLFLSKCMYFRIILIITCFIRFLSATIVEYGLDTRLTIIFLL